MFPFMSSLNSGRGLPGHPAALESFPTSNFQECLQFFLRSPTVNLCLVLHAGGDTFPLVDGTSEEGQAQGERSIASPAGIIWFTSDCAKLLQPPPTNETN